MVYSLDDGLDWGIPSVHNLAFATENAIGAKFNRRCGAVIAEIGLANIQGLRPLNGVSLRGSRPVCNENSY